MKPSRLRTYVAWVSLLSYLLVILGGVGNIILCLKADGRSAIEIMQGDSCDVLPVANKSTVFPFTDNNFLFANNDQCRPCTDILLVSSKLGSQYIIPSSRQDKSQSIQSSKFLSFSYPKPVINQIKSGGVFSTPQPPVNPTLASLCTIVLLI